VHRSAPEAAAKQAGFSTLPTRVSHWLHRDLPSHMEQLRVSVTVVTARTSTRRLLTER
jgi:hypothetical protein